MTPPLGDPCPWCGEPVAPGEDAYELEHDSLVHLECAVRLVFGSVGHLERICSGFAGSREDPPGLTRREAARAVYRFLKVTLMAPLRN